ncbi:MAG: hypothetical protein IT537_02655 [Hyphomicrobiales bacterium]|nr:hypothetical protein [Hyphomicrobiales bacterium]
MYRHLTILALTLVATAPVVALELPTRKAGLWELKMSFEGRNMPPQVTQHCIDAESDKLMSAIGNNMPKDTCRKQETKKVGNTFVIDAVCKVGTGTTTSQSVISGDFNSAYTVKVSSKREGGAQIPGLPADGTSNMTLEAKWTGPCKADQKGGDMIMSNGMKMNIRDLQNMPAMLGGGTRPAPAR